ncbi:MAG: hypothetical protein DI640_14715, partial [Sphingomonas taxi]
MPDAIEIIADPAWFPHRLDAGRRIVEFIRMEREDFAAQGFLADRDPPASERTSLAWDDVVAMAPGPARVHFIFHTAFCRSTLLVRAIDRPGRILGLNEPGVIASLVNAGPAAEPLVEPVLALLARPQRPGEQVFVKPTNHANRLMPALMRAMPDARAILMTNPLPSFLRSAARKGMMGRRWGRQLYLEMQAYGAMDFGMDGRETFSMTDLQAAALAWFLAQRWFALHATGQVRDVAPDRFAVLDGDRFDAERETTLRSLFEFCDVADPPALAQELADGPVFSQHSKTGGSFVPGQDRRVDENTEEEIAQVGQWIDLIAKQSGLPLP